MGHFYAHRNEGQSVGVKDGAFFEQQGGLKQGWGAAWTRFEHQDYPANAVDVTSLDIERARKYADDSLPPWPEIGPSCQGELFNRLHTWLMACQQIVKQGTDGRQTLELDDRDSRTKFQRVVMVGGQRSCWCFVALCDGQNKELGEWKKGDVMMSGGWKGPAKHARGNIFDDKNGLGKIKWIGPEYLR